MRRLDEDSRVIAQFILVLAFATTVLFVMRLLK